MVLRHVLDLLLSAHPLTLQANDADVYADGCLPLHAYGIILSIVDCMPVAFSSHQQGSGASSIQAQTKLALLLFPAVLLLLSMLCAIACRLSLFRLASVFSVMAAWRPALGLLLWQWHCAVWSTRALMSAMSLSHRVC